MLKSIIYLLLFAFGLGATFASSLWGGVSVILAFMLNPIVVARELPLQRYQFYVSIAFILSVMMHPVSRLKEIGLERLIFQFLWWYVAVTYLTSLWATDGGHALSYAFNFSKTILVAWLFTKIVHDESGMRLLITACLIGAFHAAFMHTVGVDMDWVSEKYADEWGVLPDMQAPVMLMFLPLLLLMAMMGRNLFEKGLCWLALPLVLNSVVESYQRAYFLGLVAETTCLLLFIPKRIAVRLVPILGTGVVLFAFVLTPDNYWSWMDTINNPKQEGSASSRFDLYESSAKMLAENPMGVGYRCYILEAHKYVPSHLLKEEGDTKAAHSTICTIACENGVIGFALWLGAIGTTLLVLRKIRKSADPRNPSQVEIYAMGLECGMVGWLIGGLFHSDHELDPAYWFCAFAVLLFRIRFSATPNPAVSVPDGVAGEFPSHAKSHD